MRRVCFDSASTYFHSFRDPFLKTPSQARLWSEGKTFRFGAATTFDSQSRRFKDFTDPKKLFAYLEKADEIITFNGRVCDLIVLEKLIGTEAMRNIWRKPHHDLQGWQASSLKSSVSQCLPDIAASFDAVKIDRLAKIGNSFDEDTAKDLANTYRDAKFTFALFQKYLASGDSEHTFQDA